MPPLSETLITVRNHLCQFKKGIEVALYHYEDEPDLSFKWLEYLPTEASIQKSMATLIRGYITLMQNEMDKEDITKEELVEFARASIRGQLSEHLLDCVEKIRARFPPGADRSRDIFPQLAGSHLKLDNPALFYAKMIMEILSAHEEVEEEVRVLRRNLFRILNTSEFSRSAADWVDPGAKLVLRDIVCQQCGVTRDVDLGVSITPECECDEIDYHANKMLIERRLIDLVRKKIISWNIQDVACIRCNEVRVRDISSLCECSGKFACMESGRDYQDFFRTVRHLAKFYKMSVLMSTVDWMLGTVGTRRTPAIKIDKKIIL